MTVEALTYDRAVELAREVVAEFGEDYVYPENQKRPETDGSLPSCVYVHEGCPSCLVGHILHRHGVSLEDLSQNEFRGAWFVSVKCADADEKARTFLDAAQGSQDKGDTWAVAVENGIAHVKVSFG